MNRLRTKKWHIKLEFDLYVWEGITINGIKQRMRDRLPEVCPNLVMEIAEIDTNQLSDEQND